MKMESIFDFLNDNGVPVSAEITFGIWRVRLLRMSGTSTFFHLFRKDTYIRGFENQEQVIEYIKGFPEFTKTARPHH